MTEITASLVKQLRETSGAGMLDCKKALEEAKGNFDTALDWLRKKGLSAAAKKSGRVASEGLIAIFQEGTKAAIIELNSETDFVAKNEKFQQLAAVSAKYALGVNGDLQKLNDFVCPVQKKKVSEAITEAIAVIGENINLRRSAALEVKEGVVASYIHNAVAPNLGKIGVLVALESSGDKQKLAALGKQIAMHVAAAKPESLDVSGVNQENLAREKAIYADQAKASGKPDNIIEKMVEGRVRKYYEQVVLLEQLFVIDGKTKISDLIAASAKDVGAPVKISGFIQFVLGEGIEKKENDFAKEVAAAAGMR